MMFDVELEELKREFLAEAAEKVREIETRLGERSAESRERLSYLAHQLKGSGGSYGFQRISSVAAELEKAIEGAAGDEALRRHAVSLRAEIDQRAQELLSHAARG